MQFRKIFLRKNLHISEKSSTFAASKHKIISYEKLKTHLRVAT